MLYVVASGGVASPGEPPNSAISVMTVPGLCNAVRSGGVYVLNELTTVASAYSLRAFLAAGAQLGSASTNTGGLGLGAATLASLVNLSTGTAPGAGFPSGGAAPTARLNMLANALNSCVTSSGPGSSACTALFSATASGTNIAANTLDATILLANDPGNNVAVIFALGQGNAAYSPTPASSPADWTLPVAFTGGGLNQPAAVAIDSVGRVWVANFAGSASLFSNTGVPQFPNGLTGYGLNASAGAAVDPNDNVWITNQQSDNSVNGGNGSVTVLNSAGPALPGLSVYTNGGIHEPNAVAIGGDGLVWICDYYSNAVTVLNSAGIAQSGAAGFQSTQFSFANSVAIDSQRHGWIANIDAYTISEITPDGSSVISYTVGAAPSSIAIDAGDNVWAGNYYGDSLGLVAGGKVLSGSKGFAGGGVDHPYSLEADGAGTVWVANYRAPGISEMAGAAAAQPGSALSPAAGWAPDLNMLQAQSLAIDAAGNIWVASNGDNRLIEYVGLATPVKTPLLGATRVP